MASRGDHAVQADARRCRALAKGDGLEPWERRRFEDRAAGARKGLDGSIGMALYDPAGVPHEDIAQAASEDVAYVEAVQARLKSY